MFVLEGNVCFEHGGWPKNESPKLKFNIAKSLNLFFYLTPSTGAWLCRRRRPDIP